MATDIFLAILQFIFNIIFEYFQSLRKTIILIDICKSVKPYNVSKKHSGISLLSVGYILLKKTYLTTFKLLLIVLLSHQKCYETNCLNYIFDSTIVQLSFHEW